MYVNFLNNVLREKYGRKMYKLALDGGMSCPNRDGTIGDRGCIFCSTEGSGEFAEKPLESVREQIERAKLRVAAKAKDCGYIAYFQSFTNTYAPTERLRELFSQVISQPDIDILSIATRPDCLSNDTVDLLAELNIKKPVWIELGLQTSNEKTAEYIRRGYKNEVYEDAVRRLTAAGIEVITHMIIGLPGENIDDMRETARYIGRCGGQGIKFHLLYVVKGTDLEVELNDGKFECLSLCQYAEILSRCLEEIPREMIVHRITGDGAKRDLVAPLWSGDKKRVLNFLNKYLKDNDIVQGKKFKTSSRH